MSVRIDVENEYYGLNRSTTFDYKGEDADLWIKNLTRVLDQNSNVKHSKALVTLKNGCYRLTPRGLSKLRLRIRHPQFYVTVEKVIQAALTNHWSDIDLNYGRELFKCGVKEVWSTLSSLGQCVFECEVLVALLQDNNGGLTVEQVMGRLLDKGKFANFNQVRLALEHLRALYLVEYYRCSYSVRKGLVDDLGGNL